MKSPFALTNAAVAARLIALVFAAATPLAPAISNAVVFNDTVGDVDPGLLADGTMDIVSTEVSITPTGDISFKLTVNGDISATPWVKYMVGLSVFATNPAGEANGWGRPIDMDAYGNKMDFWIGVGGINYGGTAEFWYRDYVTGNWVWEGYITVSLTGGSTSAITIIVPQDYISAYPGMGFFFDAYSSGPDSGDGAADAAANPLPTISDWSQPYTSESNGTGVLFYQIPGGTRSLTLSCSSPDPNALAFPSPNTHPSSAVARPTDLSPTTYTYNLNAGVSITVNPGVYPNEVLGVVDKSVSPAVTNWGAFPTGLGYTMDRDYSLHFFCGPYGFYTWQDASSLPLDRRGWTNRNGPLNLPNGINYTMGYAANPSELPRLVGTPAPGTNSLKFAYSERLSPVGYDLNPKPEVWAATNPAGPWTPANVLSKTTNGTSGNKKHIEATVGIPSGATSFFLRLQASGSFL